MRQSLAAGGGQDEVLAPAAAAFGRGFSHPGPNVALALEPLQRHIRGADRQLTARALLDLAPNRGSISIRPQPNQGKQHGLFKFTQHMIHIVK